MRSKRTNAAFLSVTLLTAALGGVIAEPGGPSYAYNEVLATIDGEVAVTFEDVRFHNLRRDGAAGGAPVTAADVEEIVKTLVLAKVLVLEAEKQRYGEDEEAKRLVNDYRTGLLRDRMRNTLLAEKPVTEEEIRELYERDTKWRKYSIIEAKNRETAEAAYRELREGRPWPEVVRKYSLVEETLLPGGVCKTPLVYDGMPASEAAFATAVGEYTPPVPANDGVRWQIYRIDKVVHGRTDTFEEGREGLRFTLEGLRAREKSRALAEELRRSVAITRNENMWRALQSEHFSDFRAKWATREAVASDVGGVIVTGGELYGIIDVYFYSSDEGVNARREKDPEDFAYVTDLLLRQIEDDALLEYEARRRGLDRDPLVVREIENFRAKILTDAFITNEFIAKLPPITDADCEAYYAAHKEEFATPEWVEVYLVAMPDRAKLESFYAEIARGADLFETGDAYNMAHGRELMDMYEPPPKLPPEKEEWLGVIRIRREPNAAEPESAFAAELRPRVFPFAGLKELSKVFPLADGRWAFYETVYYQPFKQGTLDEPGTKLQCRKKGWAAFYAGEEVERRSEEWLASLKAKHKIEFARERFGEAARALNAER
jgi:hypothetical protein